MFNQNRVLFQKDAKLNLYPFLKKRNYGFTLQNFENEELINTIHYEIDIVCIQNNQNHCVFEIDRKQIFIDQQAPDLKIEEIADASSKAIFPIRLLINQEGDIAKIINHETIKQRWIPIKEQVQKYYQGKIVASIIDKIETVLLNENLLEKAICKNWFFHLYFKQLYLNYPPETPKKHVWESPVFGNQTIKYEVNHSMEEFYSGTNKIFINAKGKSIDERTISEVLDGFSYSKAKMAGIIATPVKSEMEVQYKLYGEDRSIFSIIGTYKTEITQKKHKVTQAEIYHLPENSSFRPHSYNDLGKKQEQFQANQEKEDSGIVDNFSTKKNHLPSPEPNQKRITFLVEEEPVKKKLGFWDKTKTVFKKNK
jgi:hypothetical protein